MQKLRREDVIGVRIAEILISLPDAPITMDGLSYSAGYLRLETGVILDLDKSVSALEACSKPLSTITRDSKYEAEFKEAIGSKIADVRLALDLGLPCIVTDNGLVITQVPALSWNRPCIYKSDELQIGIEPLWSK